MVSIKVGTQKNVAQILGGGYGRGVHVKILTVASSYSPSLKL